MEFEKIKELIKIVDSSNLAFFELENGNEHIKMDKSLVRGNVENKTNSSSNNSEFIAKEEINNCKKIESTKEEVEEVNEDDGNITITSPMVGTFYSSSSPEGEPFIKTGDTISKGKIICIIEAMKLMNEIESEYNGIITKCLVNNGDMVEYGQPLFKVKGE